ARGVARCKYITPELIDIQTAWRSAVKSPRREIMKPILLIVSAIVAFGSIVARVDPIDTEHLFGFTIGTDVGEIGEKELESNTLWRAGVLPRRNRLRHEPRQHLQNRELRLGMHDAGRVHCS